MDKVVALFMALVCLLYMAEAAAAEPSPYSVTGDNSVPAEIDPYEFCRAHFGNDISLPRDTQHDNAMTNEEQAPRDDIDDYNDNLARLLFFARKRSCIRRGGSCDHRPSDCCYSSSCRCNLWGTNCRCQRMGLFQKWGRK
ncbi:uncharacterized protein LOC135400905 isoform X2 [Ornithodoros turicata]|uniref:uncharacterized protein LOC135400905 isoform X2 n=1 Tax=Ornithodoros turicata TaxID=34597 RepID=UPI00313A3262